MCKTVYSVCVREGDFVSLCVYKTGNVYVAVSVQVCETVLVCVNETACVWQERNSCICVG